MLPTEVIEQLSEAFANYKGTGMSVMEISRQSKEYSNIFTSAEKLMIKPNLVHNRQKANNCFLRLGAACETMFCLC